MDEEPRRKGPWQPWQYVALVVIAILVAFLLLRPLGSGMVSPFQAITSSLSSQQR